jgi:hypothetical protein
MFYAPIRDSKTCSAGSGSPDQEIELQRRECVLIVGVIRAFRSFAIRRKRGLTEAQLPAAESQKNCGPTARVRSGSKTVHFLWWIQPAWPCKTNWIIVILCQHLIRGLAVRYAIPNDQAAPRRFSRLLRNCFLLVRPPPVLG